MTRSELTQYFETVRYTTEKLCEPLETEDHVVQPILDVSPPKWHLGHTTWFFEAMLLQPFTPEYKPYHSDFSYIFNSYYESLGSRVQRPLRGNLSRPSVEETVSYRDAINQRMGHLIQEIDESQWPRFSGLVELGLNHEQQHQELLVTDIKYILAGSPLKPAFLHNSHQDGGLEQNIPESAFIRFSAGLYEIGHRGEDSFSYDNEGPRHKVYVDDFGIQNRLITNGEYLMFIEAGGYSEHNYWLSDGWDLIQAEGWSAPLYWENRDGQWFEYTLSGLQPINFNNPVCHISYYEADAFAQWSGKRLPTEAEWEIATQVHELEGANGNFMDNMILHPTPAKRPIVSEDRSLHQMLGDVWEFTSSAYLPYPGYRRVAGPLGEYNGKFMINQMVLRGGSCATSRSHIRTTYRNFFQPDKRWQFNGFRLAE